MKIFLVALLFCLGTVHAEPLTPPCYPREAGGRGTLLESGEHQGVRWQSTTCVIDGQQVLVWVARPIGDPGKMINPEDTFMAVRAAWETLWLETQAAKLAIGSLPLAMTGR